MTSLGMAGQPLHVAVVGSGPSGFYAAEALFKSGLQVCVSMIERLPCPYGLVRSGVAPDHPKLKQAIEVYARIADTPGFSYFGNVTVGRDVSVAELRDTHHAVILSCGAEADRSLGVPGEDLKGSHAATEFVGWYNGHPDYRNRTFDLSHPTAVVIGQGNVAADVARILAKTPDELKHTDIAQHALEVLAESRIREIFVVGRRGPAQAKFTSKELKEFGELAACEPFIDPAELKLNEASTRELEDKSNAGTRKVCEIFSEFASRTPAGKPRRLIFTFLKSPKRLVGAGHVTGIELEQNQLTGPPMNQSAKGTGLATSFPAGIVFRSIGYRGVAMPGVPFDVRAGVFANDNGRIVEDGAPVPQLYAAGWIKRGPTGIIGTNRADSVATVAAVLEDMQRMPGDTPKPGAGALQQLLAARRVRPVSFAEWKIINLREIGNGQSRGKPREKFTAVDAMLAQIE